MMMLGDFITWLYEDLAGIKPDVDRPGFKHIIMKPTLIDGLSYVKASYNSPYGKIISEWKVSDNEFEWKLSIPANTVATIFIPAKDKPSVIESGKEYQVTDNSLEKSVVKLYISSGNYHFVSRLK